MDVEFNKTIFSRIVWDDYMIFIGYLIPILLQAPFGE